MISIPTNVHENSAARAQGAAPAAGGSGGC